MNVAWVNFANDSPNPSLPAFNTLFKNTHDAGGRVVRWWFHTNGSVTPGYDANGMASKLSQTAIDGVKSILAAAVSNGVRVTISLWSFDMLQSNAGNAIDNNKKLLTIDANRQAYIDNALKPLVTALIGNPGLYAYEIFNEPEGMTTENGWATQKVAETYIQKTVNWFAAAIHDTDPKALVTNGAWTFKGCSTGISGMQNYYSDEALRTVGGKMNGTLDFYEVHYYTGNGVQFSPFKNPYGHWGLDKKLVIGEFYTLDNDGVAGADTYTYLYDNGYSGAWAWQYLQDDAASTSNLNGMSTKWPAMKVPMENLVKAHPDSAMCP
ncbi:MAG TPA: cellulase family glycosylhydrolase [Polyangia bacterium]|nr:cellulase family glycosylhydrolase [Polyangia bacterium]